MTPLNEFVNKLQSLAKNEGLSNDETKKRLLSWIGQELLN